MASNPKYAAELKLAFLPLIHDEEKKKIFREILANKFKKFELRELLKSTGAKTLIEFSRSAERNHKAGKVEKWAAMVVDNKVIGQNLMGRLIMEARRNNVEE